VLHVRRNVLGIPRLECAILHLQPCQLQEEPHSPFVYFPIVAHRSTSRHEPCGGPAYLVTPLASHSRCPEWNALLLRAVLPKAVSNSSIHPFQRDRLYSIRFWWVPSPLRNVSRYHRKGVNHTHLSILVAVNPHATASRPACTSHDAR